MSGPDTRVHRPALDGVRALAVVAVMVYHFGGGAQSWLPGGFLGVDVFFVLSGYLITGLLLAEHDATGTIRLVRFWLRRARRLLPALLVMLAALSLWLWWASPPDSYPRRRSDLLWTLAQLANWHAVAVAEDYFAAYAGASPLRHAWSLAVEQQFYLVWPLVLLAVSAVLARFARARFGAGWRSPRAWWAAVCVLSIVASAVVMAWQYRPGDPTRAYYGTEGRVQQLLLGALLALVLTRVRVPARFTRWCAPIAVAALLVGFVLMDDVAAPYYHGGALLVAVAAAGLLAGLERAPDGVTARVFALSPFVLLGRVSYGVYLWHWPVTVAVPVAGYPPDEQLWRQVTRLLVTVGAAAASYVLVERPVQRGAWWRPARRLVPALALAVGVVTATAVQATALPQGVAGQLTSSFDRPCPGESPERLTTCDRPIRDDAGSQPGGSQPGGSQPGRSSSTAFVLAGDSIARSLQPGLDAWAETNGRGWVQAAWKQCSAAGLTLVPHGRVEPDRLGRSCAEQAPGLLDAVLARHPGATVLLAELTPALQAVQGPDGQLAQPGTAAHRAALVAGYLRLADRVGRAGGRLALVELPPAGRPLGTVLAAERPAGRARPTPPSQAHHLLNSVFAEASVRHRGVLLVSVTDLVCPGSTCRPLVDGVLVRTDGVHYSAPFARVLAPALLSRAGIGS